MVTRQYYVYGFYRDLACTDIFYVGKGKGKRETHWSRQKHREKNLHLKYLLALVKVEHGFVPTQRLYDNLTEEEAFALEVETIAKIGRYPNGPLVNIVAGGRGGAWNEGILMPEEVKTKISAKLKGRISPMKGRTLSEETKDKLRNPSQETRLKMSLAKKGKPPPNKGKPMPEEQLLSQIGRRHTDATKLQISQSKTGVLSGAKGKPRPPHVIEAMRQANIGRPLSEEHKRKMSETLIRVWENPGAREQQSVLMKAGWEKRRARNAEKGIRSYAEIARENGIKPKVFCRLLRKGLSIEEAIAAAKSSQQVNSNTTYRG